VLWLPAWIRGDQLCRPRKRPSGAGGGAGSRHRRQPRVGGRAGVASRPGEAAVRVRRGGRVNPDFELKSSGMKMGGDPSNSEWTPSVYPRCSCGSDSSDSIFRAFTFSGSRTCAQTRSRGSEKTMSLRSSSRCTALARAPAQYRRRLRHSVVSGRAPPRCRCGRRNLARLMTEWRDACPKPRS